MSDGYLYAVRTVQPR